MQFTLDSTAPVGCHYDSNSPVDYGDSYLYTSNADVQLLPVVWFVVAASIDFESIERFHRSLYDYELANCRNDHANLSLNSEIQWKIYEKKKHILKLRRKKNASITRLNLILIHIRSILYIRNH